ncbi:MAG: archease [Betaproteobacteria bacterium]|nr:archease [Betaproteobacteria bacterium]
MTNPDPTTNTERREHFAHEADIGVRGFRARSLATAFAQAAIALTAVVCDPVDVQRTESAKLRVRGAGSRGSVAG